jgi:hypothetical protein
MWSRKVFPSCVLLGLLLGGCVEVNGGAVEVAWVIQTTRGGQLDSCVPALVERMQLCRAPVGTTMETCQDWECEPFYGSTDFDIAEGAYSFRLQPLCTSGLRPGVQLPSPIVRDIVPGRVASLNALLIVGDDLGRVCQ